MRRLLVPPDCIEGRSARLQGAVRHHLVNVLRLRPGAPLLLLDGAGRAYRGELVAVDETAATVRLDEELPEAALAGPRLTLIYGLSKRPRTEWVLQKSTELGVDEIVLAECRRSVARAAQGKLPRFSEIVRQAARQCGRGRLPVLGPPAPLVEALAAGAGAELRLLAEPGAEPLSSLWSGLGAPPASVALVIGPEGGLCEEELAAARAQGYRPVGLGPLVLRTETAALVLLALAAFLGGRLDS